MEAYSSDDAFQTTECQWVIVKVEMASAEEVPSYR